MDYEKKYNEALERAKAAIDIAADKDLVKGVATTIFPELRESEYERIRKGLIKLLTVASEAYLVESTGIKKDSYLSYLEKQKQKPTDLPAGFYYIDLNGNRYYSKEFRYGDMKLKVGEQKPAWSEEDEKMLDSILAELANHICYNKPLDGMPSGTGWTSYKYQQEMDWLTNRLKSLRPQPKQEWSEEDTLMQTAIIQTLERFGGRGTTGMQIDWLKSRLPLFKPSEEDERILKGIIGKIDHGQTYGVSKDEMLNFLKRRARNE